MFSLTSIREWATGRWWWWRAPILLFFVAQALRPLRGQGEWTLFSGIIFGAHEFGHLFWMFFGEWMGVAGGSLTQLLIPVGAAAVVLRSRDWFGVAICGVFLATSLGELSWYIADARRLELDLVSFSEEGGIHDWNYLLNSVGLIRQDRVIAGLTRFTGIVVLLASFVFALQLLWWMATLKPADAPVPSPDV